MRSHYLFGEQAGAAADCDRLVDGFVALLLHELRTTAHEVRTIGPRGRPEVRAHHREAAWAKAIAEAQRPKRRPASKRFRCCACGVRTSAGIAPGPCDNCFWAAYRAQDLT